MAPTLGYWKVRGLAEPIRLLLAHSGQEYEMKYYNFGPEPDFDRSEWLDEKFNLGLDFPNLPYYVDEDEGVKITQSVAIIRYLARKHGLNGESEEEIIKLDMVEQFIMDLIMYCAKTWYSKDEETFERGKEELIPVLTAKLSQLTEFLGENQFLLGEKVTYVDFLAYSYLDYLRLFEPSIFDEENLSKFNDYLSRIEALPEIEKYLSSEDFSRFPLSGPMARFGGSAPSE